MKCVAAVLFLASVLTHEVWSKPSENIASRVSIGDLGTNVGGRLGSALGQTVGAGLDSVQQLGAGVLGLGAGLVGGVGSGLGSGLQTGLSSGRGEQGVGVQTSVDLNAGANGLGRLNVDANAYNDRSSYPNSYPINTNNAVNGPASGVGLGYRTTPEYGYGGNYATDGGFNGGGNGQRVQYPGAHVYTDHGYPNNYAYNPHGAGYVGNYVASTGLGYQNVAPPVYHSTYPYNSPYNMNDPRIGINYGPGYRPAVEYVNSGNFGSGRHYPIGNGQGHQYIGAHAYPDQTYPNYYPTNIYNARLDGGYANGRGFDNAPRSHRVHNAEANRNRNHGSYPSSYPVNSNNAGPGTSFSTNYDTTLEYGDGIRARPGNGLGNRANNGFPAETGIRSDAEVSGPTRHRPEPGYDDATETAFDARFGIGSSVTSGAEAMNAGIGVGPSVERGLESGSTDRADATVNNGVRPIDANRSHSNARIGVEDGVGKEVRPSAPTRTESDVGATVDNEAGIGTRV